jgi:hypothetical protein
MEFPTFLHVRLPTLLTRERALADKVDYNLILRPYRINWDYGLPWS